jgi:hypothetical protein
MFGSILSHSETPGFHGTFDPLNFARLQEFLVTHINTDHMYMIHEFDIQGNPYSRPIQVAGKDLHAHIRRYMSHVTHRYEIRDQDGNTICRTSFTYSGPKDVAQKVHAIMH